ncbi:MAG: hypothetical protein AAF668_16560 [Pseudomonadota bacterium]
MKKLMLSMTALAFLAGCETLEGHQELQAPCAPGAQIAALDNPCERKPINLAAVPESGNHS